MTWLSWRMLSRPGLRCRGRVRPQCEQLEGRVVPAGVDYPRLSAAMQAAWGQMSAEIEVASIPRYEIDFNGDGWKDRVELRRGENTRCDVLCVYKGKANGEFEMSYQLTLGHVARQLLVEDFDQDGRVDVFAAGEKVGLGTLLLGKGDGTFEIGGRPTGQIALTVADLTGDGQDDFVFANPLLDRIAIRWGNGNWQTFSEEGGVPMIGPSATHLVDFDGDGILDLFVCSPGAQRVFIFPGLGKGEFGPELHGGEGLFTGYGPVQVTVARLFDQVIFNPQTREKDDPYLDLIITNQTSGELAILFGQGGWAMSPPLLLPVGLAPTSVWVGDLTKNQLPELVVTASGSNQVLIVPRGEGGSFEHQRTRILPTGLQPLQSFVADFDGDGKLDLVTLDAGSNALSFYSDVNSDDSKRKEISSGGKYPIAGLLRDVNGDGRSDLVVANHEDGQIALFLGTEEGLTLWQAVASPGVNPTALAGSSSSGDPWRVYVAHKDSEGVLVVQFSLPESEPDPSEAEPEAPSAEPPPLHPPVSQPRLQLESLSPFGIDLVPTLIRPVHEADAQGWLPLVGEEEAGPKTSGRPAEEAESNPTGGEEQAEETEELPTEEAVVAEAGSRPSSYLLEAEEAVAPPIAADGSIQRETKQKRERRVPLEEKEGQPTEEAEAEKSAEVLERREVEEPARPRERVIRMQEEVLSDLALLLAVWSWRREERHRRLARMQVG